MPDDFRVGDTIELTYVYSGVVEKITDQLGRENGERSRVSLIQDGETESVAFGNLQDASIRVIEKRKPVVGDEVSTEEELEALPELAIVTNSAGYAFQKKHGIWHYGGSPASYTELYIIAA